MAGQELQEYARGELAKNMVPMPDDLLSEIDPVAAVWYLQEVAGYVTRLWLGVLSEPSQSAHRLEDMPLTALDGLTETLGMITGVCISLGLVEDATP